MHVEDDDDVMLASPCGQDGPHERASELGRLSGIASEKRGERQAGLEEVGQK